LLFHFALRLAARPNRATRAVRVSHPPPAYARTERRSDGWLSGLYWPAVLTVFQGYPGSKRFSSACFSSGQLSSLTPFLGMPCLFFYEFRFSSTNRSSSPIEFHHLNRVAGPHSRLSTHLFSTPVWEHPVPFFWCPRAGGLLWGRYVSVVLKPKLLPYFIFPPTPAGRVGENWLCEEPCFEGARGGHILSLPRVSALSSLAGGELRAPAPPFRRGPPIRPACSRRMKTKRKSRSHFSFSSFLSFF